MQASSSMAEDSDAFDSERDDFGGALFGTLNNKDSQLNVLIGSRKFTEGWSSWRVSTMGLLNMGQGEGSQIIQLFGRGVRLKGKGFSLKRTTPQERPKGIHLDKLEALNIFGVRASYMAAFKDYLREEGITPSDEILELDFPTRANLPAGKLKTLALKDGYKDNQKLGFKRTHFPWLYEIPEQFKGKIKTHTWCLTSTRASKHWPRTRAPSTHHDRGEAQGQAEHEPFPSVRLGPHLPGAAKLQAAAQLEQPAAGSTEADRLLRRRIDWYTLFVPAAELAVSTTSATSASRKTS
jgi:hypothetical protein